jgi:hypothetical protein
MRGGGEEEMKGRIGGKNSYVALYATTICCSLNYGGGWGGGAWGG